MKTKTLLVSTAAALLVAFPLLADVREGLVAYWPLNTATGAYPMTTPDVVAGNDLSGPNMDSSTALVAGHFGSAVTFDGGISYLTFQAPAESDTGLPVSKKGSWSISVWVNGAAQAGGNYYFVESSSINNNPLTALIARANTNTTGVYFRDASGGNPVNLPTVTNISLNSTWHHVALTYDAVSRAFLHYVDGSLAYSNNFAANYANSSVNDLVNLGARNRNGVVDLFFAGQVDDLALWARALSQAEVQEVMATGIATPVPQFKPVLTVQPKGATNLYAGDNHKMTTAVYGSRPLTYQWLKDGTNYPGATDDSLTLSAVTPNDNGQYQLVIANASGSTTSLVAQVTVNAFGSPNLTNGIIAYYPCDSIVAGKAPELVAAYDMPLFGGMNATNIVQGKWGNALNFDKAVPQYGKKVFAPGDGLPGIRRTNITYSVWVNNAAVSSFQFGEASSLEAFTFHGFGGLGGAGIRMYIRNSGGSVYSDTQLSSPTVWDQTWHNVIYSQHDIGGGALQAQLYVDGVLVATPATSIASLAPDSLGFCINPRSTLGSASGGALDEIVYWNRVLSPEEIALVQTSYITNPPSLLPPLAITSFKADLAGVVTGDSTKLNWDVPGNVTSATISGVGDVTARTLAAGGTTNIAVSVTNTTTYTLTITRGVETVSKSVTIGAVKGVAAGWSLLDNFDFYQPGVLTTNETWNAIATPDTLMVVQPTNQNRQAACYAVSGDGSGGILNLQGLAVTAGQARTLFFRMTPLGTPAADVSHLIGITERVGTFWYYMTLNNSGPLAYPKWDNASSAWWMGVSQNGAGYAYDTSGLTPDAVYKVWIDVTNVPIVNVPGERVIPDEEDLFSVYIQKEGDPDRTLLFENITSDRALNTVDDFTGTHYPDDVINKLYLMGVSLAGEVLFDDIYLSKTGILTTTPIGPGYAGTPPTLQIVKSGGQWQVVFQGKLLEAPSVNGPWTDVAGATSPYPVTTAGGPKFYRAVSN